jgi:hypothetical protein
MDMLERAARAFSTRVYGNDREWKECVDDARAVLQAIKYEDGTDESVLIDVSNKYRIEAVSLSEAWDAMIDAALTE